MDLPETKQKAVEKSEIVRIKRTHADSLRRLNAMLYDAGAAQKSERREGTAIAIRELALIALRLQTPAATVILRSQLEELEQRAASQRAVLEQFGDLIDRHETASAEARRRVTLTETRNADLREALHTVCYWLAFALVRKSDNVDAAARTVREAAEARVAARHAASAEGREFTDEDETDFVKDFPRYRVSGERLAKRARKFPPESAEL
ncbi:MAG: hypothetical protein OXD36_18135 [Rhodobacter sp.]|nr:hypothetical protein [Rhodobacter sp.]